MHPCLALIVVKKLASWTANRLSCLVLQICVRAPTVFKGYYKDQEKTNEVMEKDGWLHSGDVGTWLPGGRLKMIDHMKNVFKLA